MQKHVYFIQRKSDNLVKIGFASNLKSRLYQLNRDYGPFTFLGVVPGDRIREHLIHKNYERYRIEGEWFQPNAEIAGYIKKNAYRPKGIKTHWTAPARPQPAPMPKPYDDKDAPPEWTSEQIQQIQQLVASAVSGERAKAKRVSPYYGLDKLSQEAVREEARRKENRDFMLKVLTASVIFLFLLGVFCAMVTLGGPS